MSDTGREALRRELRDMGLLRGVSLAAEERVVDRLAALSRSPERATAQPEPRCPTDICSACYPGNPCRPDCHICHPERATAGEGAWALLDAADAMTRDMSLGWTSAERADIALWLRSRARAADDAPEVWTDVPDDAPPYGDWPGSTWEKEQPADAPRPADDEHRDDSGFTDAEMRVIQQRDALRSKLTGATEALHLAADDIEQGIAVSAGRLRAAAARAALSGEAEKR